jgi:rhodanese-related sulfurtransferase
MNNKKPIGLTPQQTLQMMTDDPRTVLVDIRSTIEFLFVGHPIGAIHVPWIDEPDWIENPNFATDIRKLILGGAMCTADDGCAPVILICRSGKRSLVAGKVLLEAGFTNVFHTEEGFEGDRDDNHHRSTVGGWRFHGLPWEQC